jgi:hypothetical protein
MPLGAEYLRNHEGQKKGTRTLMSVREFLPLKRAGIVKRVPSNFVTEARKQVHENSFKNLLKGKKKK